MEEQIIEAIRRCAGSLASSLVRQGIGDDTAIVAPLPAGRELLVTTDQVIENTHFVRSLHPPRALGSKTLARGLSDIAAMGGEPFSAFLSLGVPPSAKMGWLKHYIHGLFDLARKFHVSVAGGDVARAERFTAAVTVLGSVPRGKALQRSGARPGDRIFVSGALGGSALGLERLLAGGASVRNAAVRRHLFPEPRLALGQFLVAKRLASAAIDLSDGLSGDLARLCEASGAGAEIELARALVFPGASREQALHGGEEYELLFTVPGSRRPPDAFKGAPLTGIGWITQRKEVWAVEGSRREKLRPAGFQHFR